MAIEIANTSIINNGIVVDDIRNLFANTLTVKTINQPFPFHSLTNGYVSGGAAPTPLSPSVLSSIDRFPFYTEITTAANIGSMTRGETDHAGQSSTTHGYNSGGGTVIDRFPFAVYVVSSTSVGSLALGQTSTSGQSSPTHGYSSGSNTTPSRNVIQRFPFAVATTNATDVGDLTVGREYVVGVNSTTFGYVMGGLLPQSPPASPIRYNIIERFPFAVATTNATDVGDLTQARFGGAGISSSTHGYAAGGANTPTTAYNIIDRFPFDSATTNATDVGDLASIVGLAVGLNSASYGYVATVDEIQNFPFAAATTNATYTGNLSISRTNTLFGDKPGSQQG